MENSKVVLKIDKKLVTTKRGSCDQFFAKIKFSGPGEAKYVSRILVLVAGPLMFQVPDVSNDVNSKNMIRNKAKSALASTTQMMLSMCSSRYCSTFAPLFLYFWTVVVFFIL